MAPSSRTADCLKSLGPYFTGVVALLIALFGEYLRRLTFKPKLSLSASSDSPHCIMNRYYSVGETPLNALITLFGSQSRTAATQRLRM
jgi:hypothetical protein